VIANDSELMAAQTRVQVIQGILAHGRRTLTSESFQAQSKGWLLEWERLDKEIRAYLSTPVASTMEEAGVR